MSKTLTVKARNAVEAEAEARRVLAERGDTSEPVHPTESPAFDANRPEYHLWQFLLVPAVPETDIQPSWKDILPVLMGVAQNPDAPVSAHRQVQANLTLMAELADRYIMLVQNGSGDLTGLTPVLTDPDAPEGETH